MSCVREYSLELSKYFFPLIEDFIHAKLGQQPWAFVLDLLHDPGTIR